MKSIIQVAALTALVSTSVAAQESIETFGGAWDTNWGEVWVFETLGGYEGTYSTDNGAFALEFTGHVFEGFWVEDMADVECAVPFQGSYYWGRLQLANSPKYPGFEMVWGYCDGPVGRVWEFRERLPDGL